MSESPSPSPPQRTRRTLKTKPKEEYFYTSVSSVNINTYEKAAKYLHQKQLIDQSSPPNLDNLVCGLFWLANQAQAPKCKASELVDLIRALAFMADAVNLNYLSSKVLEFAGPKLDEASTSLDAKLSTTLKQASQKVNDLTKQLEDVLDNAQNAINLQSRNEADFTTLTDKLLDRIDVIEKKIEVRNFVGGPGTHANSLPQPKRGSSLPPPSLSSALARESAKAKELIIDGLLKKGLSASDLQEDALVQKCNLAIKFMKDKGLDVPTDLTFVCARKLRNEGVVFELDKAMSVQWLTATSERVNMFINHLGEEVSVKPQTYSCFVEFVPVSFNAEQGGITQLESHNHLTTGCVHNTRWVKNPARRREGQLTAHLVINFKSPVTANISIRDGLIINGKKVNVRKHEPDAIRCLGCQGWGHVAARCPCDTVKCAHCAEKHDSNTCIHKDDPNKHRCANCKGNHTAWDRTCPAAIEARAKLIERNPVLKYKYFLTDDPSTWELLGEPSKASSTNLTALPSSDRGWEGFHSQSEDDWNVVDRSGTHGQKPTQRAEKNARKEQQAEREREKEKQSTLDAHVRFAAESPRTPLNPLPTTPPPPASLLEDESRYWSPNEHDEATATAPINPAWSPSKLAPSDN